MRRHYLSRLHEGGLGVVQREKQTRDINTAEGDGMWRVYQRNERAVAEWVNQAENGSVENRDPTSLSLSAKQIVWVS